MNASILMFGAFCCYGLAFAYYGRFLARTYQLDARRQTPAQTMADGVDYVPAKHPWVLFGHHFSSICGAGPIVGPVLACAYWGWGVSIIWIVIGAIWMGAVSDFSALIISVRSKGESIAKISGIEISQKTKLYFSIFIWISLLLVIAVFAIFAAKTFIKQPDAVVPSFGLIPTAVLAGWLVYVRKVNNTAVTLFSLAILAYFLYLGRQWQVVLPATWPVSAENIWIIILLVYCFIASICPVNILLQPRDYLASFILFGVIAIGIVSIFVVRPVMQAPFYTQFVPGEWPKAGPLWPMLFVTIACGAISGFHALVSSGTTSKQICSETHTCPIGYGGMLLESVVGTLVVIAVCAGLSQTQMAGTLKSGGPIAVFSQGYGAMTKMFLGNYGQAFAVLALNAFILTTLDTATRITRYITTELFGINNKYLASFIAVFLSGALALTGKWNLLWPAFGAANQLIAGLTLLVASCWLIYRGRNYLIALIPAFLMLLTTIGAFAFQFFQAVTARNTQTGAFEPDIIIAVITVILTGVSISVIAESVKKLISIKKQQVKAPES